MALRKKRTGTAKGGTAQPSGAASKQGKRQRAAAPEPEPVGLPRDHQPSPAHDADPIVHHFATVVSGECAGLYGTVDGVDSVDESGAPLTARFKIRSLGTCLVRPDTGGSGELSLPWSDLRRSAAGGA